ncbi:hypothetical protein FRACA_650007 [Frankia canadensis]|uniref:Uncharacterized protein n=1 Tax=Frankia canadensis TaxID=1836972 RepID=A0A2I2KZZ8_9ACTN|nr:hypothetical protein FRACA_650007 [Frankia canadensis]SOU58534.1 hypothetical protein FRACA_650007 [Frankia canadensis]
MGRRARTAAPRGARGPHHLATPDRLSAGPRAHAPRDGAPGTDPARPGEGVGLGRPPASGIHGHTAAGLRQRDPESPIVRCRARIRADRTPGCGEAHIRVARV